MVWRGSTSMKDRIFAILPYAYPMVEAAGLGMFLRFQFPILDLLLLPLTPFSLIYGFLIGIFGRYTSLLIFMALYILVVRNERISHFIRFNTMQALLIGIVVSLVMLVLDLIGIIPGRFSYGLSAIAPGPAMMMLIVLFSTLFLGVMIASIYSIVLSFMGKYGEIPVVSDAAHAQVRY